MLPKQDSSPVFSLIMPAFNEGRHIYENIVRVVDSLEDFDFEIIVVDDGSTDDTYTECQRAKADGLPVHPLRHETNKGKGASLFHGFDHSNGELVAFLDSDLEIAPENISKLLDIMRETKADVVAGVKDFQANQFPPLRRWMSRVYRGLVSFLFGLNITDTQTGIKLFRRQVLIDAIPRISARRFAFDIELLVAASRFGYKIVEQPVEVNYHRSGGLGRMNSAAILGTFLDTLAIFYRASFWHWLNPGLLAQIWMALFVLGVFLSGIGVAKLITPIIPQGAIKQVTYFILLQFLPASLRNWLVTIIGVLSVIFSLIQLNKIIMKAFAHHDRGDISGIMHK
jgi:glycosyltransferase involved in cell wall biosynthesis